MGLAPHDLEDLVSNLLSIDEFESKIDNQTCIVVAFKVSDVDPAKDLSRFIEKSTVEILDTEVSPAPDVDGKFIVFVEFNRNKRFPQDLITILNTLENIVDINVKNYKFTAYKVTGEHFVTEENLIKYVRLEELKEESSDITKSVKELVEEMSWIDALAHLRTSQKLRLNAGHYKEKSGNTGFLGDWREQRAISRLYHQVLKEKFSDPNLDKFIEQYSGNLLDKISLESEKLYYSLECKYFDDEWDNPTHDNAAPRNFTITVHLRKLNLTGEELSKITNRFYFNNQKKNTPFILVFHSDPEREDFINYFAFTFTGKANAIENISYKFKVHESKEDKINNFFKESHVDQVIIKENSITIEKGGNQKLFDIIDINNPEHIFKKYRLTNLPFSLTETAQWLSRDMNYLLGAGYATNLIKGFALVSKEGDHNVLLLKEKP